MKHARGFTLVETLLYILIISFFLLISSAFLIQMIQGIQKADELHEVNEGGNAAMTRILTTIRSAESVTSPVMGTSANELVLATFATSTNPTRFFVENEVIRIKAGTNATTTLTANEIRVTGLTFTNVSATGTPGSIQVHLSVSSTASDIGIGEDVGKVFIGSATIRRRL